MLTVQCSSCQKTQRERLLAQHLVGHAADLPGVAVRSADSRTETSLVRGG